MSPMKPWKPNYSITPDIARSLTNQTVQGFTVYRQFTGNLSAMMTHLQEVYIAGTIRNEPFGGLYL